jgi:hypothetical protein
MASDYIVNQPENVMKNISLVIFTSFSICACTSVQKAATPVATPPSALSAAGGISTLATFKAELEAMFDSDQKVREGNKIGMDQKAMRAMWEKMQIIDPANQLRLDEIVKKHGWPEAKDVGTKAVIGAFIVVQHSPREMMKRYAQMVQKAMERGDLSKDSFARFDDRLRMKYDQSQRYGTQVNTDANGIRTLWQIEDEANVDKRRAEVGLEPLAEYAKRNSIPYIPYAERIAREAETKTRAKK